MTAQTELEIFMIGWIVQHQVLASAEDQIVKLQTIVSNQRNDKETIVDLKNRILEYEQNSHDAVREFKKFKVHTQGDISMWFHCTRNIDNNHVHATRCQSSGMFNTHELWSDFHCNSNKMLDDIATITLGPISSWIRCHRALLEAIDWKLILINKRHDPTN